jgi:methylmalonyl-CoA mutase
VRDTLAVLQRAARDGEGNLLELTIACMRARATVGECTQALEAVWPRHAVDLPVSAQVYGEMLSSDAEWMNARAAVQRVTKQLGRAPRILLAKLGQDGHDRGARVVAAALQDAGFSVTTGAMFASAEAVSELALKHDVDVIGVSSLAGAHVELMSGLLEALRDKGSHIPVVIGGNIDSASWHALKKRGVARCFPTGASIGTIVTELATYISEIDFAALS